VTYDQLAAFVRVASLGSFTGASASLHKSQPAVSKLVRNLEEELGLVLFDRSAYRATLSDAGRLFFERAAALLESSEALRSFGLELAGAAEPIVRLAVDAVLPLGGVLEVLRAVQARFPSVRIELRTERLSGAIQALEEDAADLALATLIGVEASPLEARRFARVRIVPVARADHPLARAGSPVPGPLLREHAQIVLRDSAHGEAPASLNVLAGGLRWSVTDVAAKKEIIAAGMGWGGLPEHAVAEELARGALVALELPEFEAELELFAVRRRDRPRGVVAEALWRRLTAQQAAA
jgi:DNA-binding transcriptional LysR family regulator